MNEKQGILGESAYSRGRQTSKGVLEGRLVVVGQTRDDVFQVDLQVETPSGIVHERVSGFEEAASAFAVLKDVNAGSLIRVHYTRKGKYKNVDLAQAHPIEVLVRAARPVSPAYRLFGGKTPNKRGSAWLACLKEVLRVVDQFFEGRRQRAPTVRWKYEKRFLEKKEGVSDE